MIHFVQTFTCNKTKNLFQFIYINQIITYVCAVDITCVDNGRVVNVRAIILLSPNLLTTHTHTYDALIIILMVGNTSSPYIIIYSYTQQLYKYICTKITHTHTRLLTSQVCVYIETSKFKIFLYKMYTRAMRAQIEFRIIELRWSPAASLNK